MSDEHFLNNTPIIQQHFRQSLLGFEKKSVFLQQQGFTVYSDMYNADFWTPDNSACNEADHILGKLPVFWQQPSSRSSAEKALRCLLQIHA